MAEIGRIHNTPITWPAADAHTVKQTGQQPRQSDKQYKQQEEHDKPEDDKNDGHIDEYA